MFSENLLQLKPSMTRRIDSTPPQKCFPGTRDAALSRVMGWVMDDQNTHHITWIFRPAGTGKYALAQTIAEMCLKDGRLVASFHFSGLPTERNNERQLIYMIAYQIVTSIPSVRPHMENALEHDPIILSKSIERGKQNTPFLIYAQGFLEFRKVACY